MMQQTQQPRRKCTRCHKLKLMADYGTKKNGGQFMSCITCRRRYYTLKDKTMKTEDTKPKKRPRRCLIINKMMKSVIRSITQLTLNCFKK